MNMDDAPAATGNDGPMGARRHLSIALVTETYPPEVNGVSATIAHVVDGLRERQHAVQLVRPRQAHDGPVEYPPGARLDEVLVGGLPIPRYPHLRMGLPAGRTLARLWAARRPDIVHIATEGPLGWSALRAATRLKLPVTSDFRTNFQAYSTHYGIGWLRGPIEAYLRRFHNGTRRTMVPTEALRRQLEAKGFERLTVVARGVDTRRFSPAHRSEELRRSWGAGPRDSVVLCVGRLAPEKNLDTLLLAWHAMRARNPAMRLVFVGDGPQRQSLAARCPGAVFAGQRRGADLAAHYASGDLMLFPSLTETFGNVTPEALSSGLPVLAFDYAAAAQMVHTGVSGALVPVGRTQAFVEQALAWAADPHTACAMGIAARQSALGHDWDRIVGQIEAVMMSAITEVSPAAPTPAPAATPDAAPEAQRA
jgi:glycosyltransferase involved in cell wall biosynthesis